MPAADARPDTVERVLLGLIRIGIALTALTPLVVTETTLFPFVVGKALYARSVIAVVFALWVVLAVLRPAWRPPRSWIAALAACCLAAALLAAVFGSSLQRSLWSDYERMGGVVDLAHWTALLVVLIATIRTRDDIPKLLAPHIAVGTIVALVAAARHAGIPLPWFGTLPDHSAQIGITLGNPILLGAYLQTVALLAAGLLARSLFGRRPRGGAALARAYHAAAVGAACWAISISGSFGAVLGLGTGLVGAAMIACLLARPPRRALLAGLLAATAAGAAGAAAFGVHLLSIPTLEDSRTARSGIRANPLVYRLVTDGGRDLQYSLATRLDNWKAGTAAFADRPLIGFGPENYTVASARHAPAGGPFPGGTDKAHNMLVEHAATTGTVGLAAYVALWAAALGAIIRAAGSTATPERTLLLFAGAALVGLFVQCQTAFMAPTVSLMATLLLAIAGRARVFAAVQPPTPGGPSAASRRPRLRTAVGCAVAVAALGLAAASVGTNRAIYRAASAILDAETSSNFMADLERSMRAFEPLANTPRLILFLNVAEQWPRLRARQPATAARLLRWAHAEARPALATEPHNWRIHDALARLADAASPDEPALAAPARHHRARVRELAPRLHGPQGD